MKSVGNLQYFSGIIIIIKQTLETTKEQVDPTNEGGDDAPEHGPSRPVAELIQDIEFKTTELRIGLLVDGSFA